MTNLIRRGIEPLYPRVGHPAKEGLRPCHWTRTNLVSNPRVGHPAKEGLRPYQAIHYMFYYILPRVGHPAKEGLRPEGQKLGPRKQLSLPEWVIQQKRD